MKIVIMHGAVAADAGPDELDVLVQVDFVSQGLAELGHEPVRVPVSLNLEAAAQRIEDLRPALVFNLVESLAGRGSLIHLVPSLLDSMGIPYTGAGTEAIMLTSNKLLAKRWIAGAGLPTPPWFAEEGGAYPADLPVAGAWLIKSVWEHASIGLDEDSVLFGADRERLTSEMAVRRPGLGGACFAEAYIEGREFNLSILEGGGGPELLPPAEIRFDNYPPGKVRVVGYRSKWEEDSFEFINTSRTFVFPEADAPLLSEMSELALSCWRLFNLRGYARIDFRVDREGRPWILEVNINPCLSPDAGFLAAALHAGLTFADVFRRILSNAEPLQIAAANLASN